MDVKVSDQRNPQNWELCQPSVLSGVDVVKKKAWFGESKSRTPDILRNKIHVGQLQYVRIIPE